MEIFNQILNFLGQVFSAVISILPSDPIRPYLMAALDSLKMYMGYLNWLIPFNQLLPILTAFIAVKGLMMMFGPILRALKIAKE